MNATTKRNFLFNITDAGFFGFGIGVASYGSTIPLFVSQLTDSPLLIALIPAIFTLGWQMPQLLVAEPVARLRRFLPYVLVNSLHQRLPFIGLALIALALPWLTPPLALMLTYLMLIWQAVGGGVAGPAWTSMIAKIMPADRIGLFFGTQASSAALGGAVGAILAGWLLDNLSPPYDFGVVFGLASVGMVLSWLFLSRTREEPTTAEIPTPTPLREVLAQIPAVLRQDMNFVWYLAARWLVQVGLMGYAFFTVYAVNTHQVSEFNIGIYTGLMLVAQMVASPLVGWLGDYYGHRRVMGLGLLAMVASVGLAIVAPSGGWFALVFFLAGIGQVAYWSPNLAIILEFAPPTRQSLYIGLANTLVAPAALLAPLLGGWLADTYSYETAFAVSLLGALSTIALLLTIVRDPMRRRAKVAVAF